MSGKKILFPLLLIVSILGTSVASFSAGDPGTTAANFLKIGVGARPVAMGGAYTALADDGLALYWNPAGLARIEKTEFSTMYNMHFQEIRQGYLSVAFPLLGGTVGLGANYMDMGQIQGRDEQGNPTGEFGASDVKASLGYANKVSSRLMFGATAGMLRETIAEDKKSTYLGNVGLLMDSEPFSFGLACQHVGSNLGEDPLPLTYRGGVALRLESLSAEVDVVKAIDTNIYYCAGLEWWIGDIFALRAGYKTGQDIGSGVSAGIGLKVSKISIDYAYVPYGDLGDTQRISLGVEF